MAIVTLCEVILAATFLTEGDKNKSHKYCENNTKYQNNNLIKVNNMLHLPRTAALQEARLGLISNASE